MGNQPLYCYSILLNLNCSSINYVKNLILILFYFFYFWLLFLLHVKCLVFVKKLFFHLCLCAYQFISDSLLDSSASASSEVKYDFIVDFGFPFQLNFFSFLDVFWIFSQLVCCEMSSLLSLRFCLAPWWPPSLSSLYSRFK